MTLNQFSAEKRLAIFSSLAEGKDPPEGSYDPAVLRQGRAKGRPQMGATRYSPSTIAFEFIYPDPSGVPVILVVTVDAPQRIVFLPVPPWVVENIWQGDVAGTHHFASDAQGMIRKFEEELEPDANLKWFQPQSPKRRE